MRVLLLLMHPQIEATDIPVATISSITGGFLMSVVKTLGEAHKLGNNVKACSPSPLSCTPTPPTPMSYARLCGVDTYVLV